jgi:hydroxymethylglutaryl-CoA reductase (NADPH)
MFAGEQPLVADATGNDQTNVKTMVGERGEAGVSTDTGTIGAPSTGARVRIPRDPSDDYSPAAARARRDFLHERMGTELQHVSSYSLHPEVLPGNVEHFIGVAQVPMGVAGPLLVHGEHARGEFFVPLATAEGTLVASYNRGMKLIYEAGGVTTTVVDDKMQRAPAFVFDSAREAREFGGWLDDNFDRIKEVAESTTRSGRLKEIERYSASRILFTRFDYTTGDAAGQNLTGKATQAACEWIKSSNPRVRHYYLESNFATDKKSSQVNMLRTRGKRVVAEATIPSELIERHMHSTSELLFRARQVSNLGGFMSGVNNNGAHSANGITALFIATGQDVANVAESSAAFVFAELLPNGDYYYSVTIPSLIVGTYGGGTGLATQRECLELLGCYGSGKVRKFAEIVAATVLCGELSLGSAVVAEEWVKAHDLYGRNRP